MKGRHDWREAVVTMAEDAADEVRLITFDVAGEPRAFEPGSHVTLALPLGNACIERSYSCLPPPAGTIRIAVKHHKKSRGGSHFMHKLKAGDRLRMTAPENRFELSWRAPAYLLVAGGIGITPILGMAEALMRRGQPVRLAYGGRQRAGMPFVARIGELMGAQAEFFAGEEGRRIDLASEFSALPPDGEAYICGPLSMLNEAKTVWAAQDRPPGRLRFEVFGDTGEKPEMPFSVAIAGSRIHVDVAADETLLDALTRAGIEMIWDCRRGECGLCAVDIVSLAGEVDHRDVFFSQEEKEACAKMCTCVSRIFEGSAVIDTGYRKA